MSTRRPPRLAVWLLNRFASIRENESFLGDLREEFHDGRTVGWYWRQTLTAIACAIGGRPTSGANRVALFAGCGISIVPLFVLWRLDVPFRSLREVNGFREGVWPFVILSAVTGERASSRVRKWMSSGSFSDQAFRWLLGYLAVDCLYLVTAGWIGWVGWLGMLLIKLMSLFREMIEMLGYTVRRRLYGERA